MVLRIEKADHLEMKDVGLIQSEVKGMVLIQKEVIDMALILTEMTGIGLIQRQMRDLMSKWRKHVTLILRWKRKKDLILRLKREKVSTLRDQVSILIGQAFVLRGLDFTRTDQALIQKDQASTQIGMKGQVFILKESDSEEGLLEIVMRMIENTSAGALKTTREEAVEGEAGAEEVQTATDIGNLKEGAGGLGDEKGNLADLFWISQIIANMERLKTTSLQVLK